MRSQEAHMILAAENHSSMKMCDINELSIPIYYAFCTGSMIETIPEPMYDDYLFMRHYFNMFLLTCSPYFD